MDDISVTTSARARLRSRVPHVRARRSTPRRPSRDPLDRRALLDARPRPAQPSPGPERRALGRIDADGAHLARRVLPAPVRRIARTRRRAISTRARAAASGTDAGLLPHGRLHVAPSLRSLLRKDPSATTPDRVVAVDVKFVVDEGYEPPQGVLQIVDDPEGILVADGRHRWTLEEVRGSNPGDDDRDPRPPRVSTHILSLAR